MIEFVLRQDFLLSKFWIECIDICINTNLSKSRLKYLWRKIIILYINYWFNNRLFFCVQFPQFLFALGFHLPLLTHTLILSLSLSLSLINYYKIRFPLSSYAFHIYNVLLIYHTYNNFLTHIKNTEVDFYN